MDNETIQQAAQETLPVASGGEPVQFKSKTKLPEDANGRMVARAVDRIVKEGAHTTCVNTPAQPGNKKCRCAAAQATSALLPGERGFVVSVVKEYRDWAAAKYAAEQAAVDTDPIGAVLAAN